MLHSPQEDETRSYDPFERLEHFASLETKASSLHATYRVRDGPYEMPLRPWPWPLTPIPLWFEICDGHIRLFEETT